MTDLTNSRYNINLQHLVILRFTCVSPELTSYPEHRILKSSTHSNILIIRFIASKANSICPTLGNYFTLEPPQNAQNEINPQTNPSCHQTRISRLIKFFFVFFTISIAGNIKAEIHKIRFLVFLSRPKFNISK